MKGVERDADREKEIKMRRLVGDPAARQDPLEILEEKIPVLEKPEHAQVDRDADHEPNLARLRLSLFAHDPAEIEIHRGRAEEEGGERRIPRAVENITRDHEQVFACRPGAHHPIRAHHHREEDDESERVKEHAGGFSELVGSVARRFAGLVCQAPANRRLARRKFSDNLARR